MGEIIHKVKILTLEQTVRLLEDEETEKILLNSYRVIQKIDKTFFNAKKIDIKDTLAVAGTPRSGTTWLMEALSRIPEYKYLFEPINPIWFLDIRGIGFSSRKYVPIDTEWPEGYEYLKKTFTGQAFSLIPPLQFKIEPMMHRIFADKLIVKFVRINRLLPWIAKRFQLRGIIFIIRHPCAVIASQIKTGFYGYFSETPPYQQTVPTLKQVIDDASKIDIIDDSIVRKLKKIDTNEEMLAALWCLDNYIPINSSKPYPWTTVFYEKLVMDEKNEISRIFKNIGEEKVPDAVIKNLRTPSMVTLGSDKELISNADRQLSKWKKTLTKKQIERILKIVRDFELDFYTDDIEPNYDKMVI